METATAVSPADKPEAFELESEYQGAIARLQKNSSRAFTALLLVGSLVAFLAYSRPSREPC